MLIREGLFEQYSNSFLVMTGPMTDIVYSRFSNDRAEHLSIRTDILEKDGKHLVRKYPANRLRRHILKPWQRMKASSQNGLKTVPCLSTVWN